MIAAVVDGKRPISPVVAELNAGTLEGVTEPHPVSYSRARDWVRDEQAKRALDEPLDRTATRAAAERIWALTGGEIRKLERDAAKTKPLDIKRAREVFGMVRDVDAFLNRGKPGRPPKDPEQPEAATEQDTTSLLETLAAQDAAPMPAKTHLPTQTTATRTTQPTVAPDRGAGEDADGEMGDGPRSLARTT